jgi:formylglycine-generating enzyme required for sulfatase activity
LPLLPPKLAALLWPPMATVALVTAALVTAALAQAPSDPSSQLGEASAPVPDATATPAGFVRIEAGEVRMGSPLTEADREANEWEHTVTLTRSFYLQAREVTQGEWQALMGTNPAHFSACGAACPVEMVSWFDAVAYANARSRAEGLPECYSIAGEEVSWSGLDCAGYRLPTEAEWEYAARAGTATPWSCGATDDCLEAVAWGWDNSQDRTQPVGALAPNAWGLYDMHGNVWEWTNDIYVGASDSERAEPGGAVRVPRRVARGGAWSSPPAYTRSAYRDYAAPDTRAHSIGLRLARTATDPAAR